jgi:hypothetical protein
VNEPIERTRTEKLARLKTIVKHIGDKWPTVLRRRTHMDEMGKSEGLRAGLEHTHSAHVHNELHVVLIVDLIREVGALVLDKNPRSAKNGALSIFCGIGTALICGVGQSSVFSSGVGAPEDSTSPYRSQLKTPPPHRNFQCYARLCVTFTKEAKFEGLRNPTSGLPEQIVNSSSFSNPVE